MLIVGHKMKTFELIFKNSYSLKSIFLPFNNFGVHLPGLRVMIILTILRLVYDQEKEVSRFIYGNGIPRICVMVYDGRVDLKFIPCLNVSNFNVDSRKSVAFNTIILC